MPRTPSPTENRWPPQIAQNAFGSPSSGSQVRTCSSPALIVKPSAGTLALTLQSAPLRRWQRLQWQ
jgi:hypothetical protein